MPETIPGSMDIVIPLKNLVSQEGSRVDVHCAVIIIVTRLAILM